MGTYPPTELRKKWGRGELTGDQAVGHLTQNVEQPDCPYEDAAVQALIRSGNQDVDRNTLRYNLVPRFTQDAAVY